MRKWLILAVLLAVTPSWARTRISGTCSQGGNVVITAGVTSTTKVVQSFPSCTVKVFATGTQNLSTIYADNAGTPLANPFTSASDGSWFFYPDAGRYDVQLSGGGLASPFTIGDLNSVQDATTGTVTGSGAVVLQTTPTLITPAIGAATGTSLNLGATGVLSTTAQSGTGSIAMTNSPNLVTPAIGAATGTSLNLGSTGVLSTTAQSGTGSIVMSNSPALVTPALGAATGTSLNLGGTGVLSTTAQSGTGSIAMTNSPAFVTPAIGAATGTSLALGGGTALATTNQSGTGNLCLTTNCALATPAISTPSVNGGINPSSTGFIHWRLSGQAYTGGAGVASSFTVTIPNSGFANANYTVIACNVHDPSGSEVQVLQCGAAKTNTTFLVRVSALTAGNGTLVLDLSAVHD